MVSVRSAKARDLARREDRSIADVVERSLEAYKSREAGREPASVFYARLANDYGSTTHPDGPARRPKNRHDHVSRC